MKDLWERIPKKDWKIAKILDADYQPVYHGSTLCPVPEVCGRFHNKYPWGEKIQRSIEGIKQLQKASVTPVGERQG